MAWLTAAAEPVAPEYSVEWLGSAYKDGDAFRVTAVIGAKEVALTWDGFAEPQFDFMDEADKKRIQKDFQFHDPATVEAFQSIARYSNWADIGHPMALGQGVSIGVTVKNGQGRVLREMSYFGTQPQYLNARRLQRIPWELKKLVAAQNAADAKSGFTTSIRNFGTDLAVCGSQLKAIRQAYHMKDRFPRAELSRAAQVLSYADFKKRHGTEWSPSVKDVEEVAGVVGAALKDCLDPSRRMALFGKDSAGGGCLVQIDLMASGDQFSGDSVTEAKLPVGSESPHYRVISGRVEELLLRFVAAGETMGWAPAPVSCQLIWRDGKLEVVEGALWFNRHPFELGQEMKQRLDWLNKEDAMPGLAAGLKGGSESLLGLVRFSAIRLHPEDPGRIKFDYDYQGESFVVEARLIDGEWTPGKRWDKEDYYRVNNVFHNSSDFRPDDDGPIPLPSD